MRAALWLMALFALAASGAWLLDSNDGTVSIFLSPYRIDLSLNLALLALLGLLVLLLLAQRALVALLSLPREARRWRMLQRERSAHAAVFEAMGHLLAGRYVRARKSAELALDRESALQDSVEPLPHAPSLRSLAHLLAAESAHALQDQALRQQHWEQALTQAQASGRNVQAALVEGLQLRQARWLLDDRDAAGSLQTLTALPGSVARRTAAMRLQLKAARLAGQPRRALETAQLLAKHRAFSAPVAQSLLRSLAQDWLESAHDVPQLTQVWLQLPEALRQTPEMATRAVHLLLALGGETGLARQWITPVWEQAVKSPRAQLAWPPLVEAIEACKVEPQSPDARVWLARIESAQQQHPGEPMLQYLAGMACHQQQLWGKAHTLLTQALKGLQTPALRRRAWTALAQMAEERQDPEAALQAWKQAAQS